MFKSKKQISINPNTTDTLIGAGTSFEGRIKSEASIRIEGQLTGDVVCAGDVIVGEKGIVKSHISARDVTIAGNVHGNVITQGKLIITSTGSLYGNTTSASFIIDEGGVFQGMSKMANKSEESVNKETSSDNGNGNGSNSFATNNGFHANPPTITL
ncbi:Polymer-forming cytoskeletal [compost metagenome]